jgi:hypothetical protein
MAQLFGTGEDVLFTDFQGQLIRLTSRQWSHILDDHEYMERMQSELRETLENPQEVRKSITYPNAARLYL